MHLSSETSAFVCARGGGMATINPFMPRTPVGLGVKKTIIAFVNGTKGRQTRLSQAISLMQHRVSRPVGTLRRFGSTFADWRLPDHTAVYLTIT
jgi:hypothetical protein